MKIINIPTENPISSCCYLLLSDTNGIIVDPGVSFASIKTMLKTQFLNVSIDGILLTHGHFDHVMALEELRKYTKAPVYIHEFDNELLPDSRKNAYYLFYGKEHAFGTADILLQDNSIINLGEEQIKVIHTPGHTRGSVCFHFGDELITGDTLFANGYGRCDLYGGDFNAIRESITKKIRILPENTNIYPGHGNGCKLSQAIRNLPF